MLIKEFETLLLEPGKVLNKKGMFSGFFMGLANLILMGVYAINFLAGAYFITDYGLSFDDMLLAMFAIIFAAFGAGFA